MTSLVCLHMIFYCEKRFCKLNGFCSQQKCLLFVYKIQGSEMCAALIFANA